MSEEMWMNRAQTAEAQITTIKEASEDAIKRIKEFKANFGVRERSNGEIQIDWDKFVDNIGVEGALELRKIIDDKYNISGEAGDKPRIKLAV